MIHNSVIVKSGGSPGCASGNFRVGGATGYSTRSIDIDMGGEYDHIILFIPGWTPKTLETWVSKGIGLDKYGEDSTVYTILSNSLEKVTTNPAMKNSGSCILVNNAESKLAYSAISDSIAGIEAMFARNGNTMTVDLTKSEYHSDPIFFPGTWRWLAW